MIRGLFIAPQCMPEVIECPDWFATGGLRHRIGADQITSIVLPTPARYRPELAMYFAAAPDEQAGLNTTATALAGPRLGIHRPVRGPAVVLVRKRSAPADLALDDVIALAALTAAAELGLPAAQ